MTATDAKSVAEPISIPLLQSIRQESEKTDTFWELLEQRLAASRELSLLRLGATLQVGVCSMDDLHRLEPDFTRLSYAEAQRRRCVVGRWPIDARTDRSSLVCLYSDPFDLTLHSWLETLLGEQVAWSLTHPANLVAYLSVQEEKLRAMDGVMATFIDATPGDDGTHDLSLKTIAQDSSPIIRTVNSTIFDAMKATASDIHLETGQRNLKIKYRIDGVLTKVADIPGLETAEQVVSRIKVMAELDISERRIPQDGRFKLSVSGSVIDFRVSIMPSLFGEDVVIRILDKRALTDQLQGLRLDHLGFASDTLAAVRKLAREPYGMFLVTGPTGSGKTTTLYGALNEINDGRDKIVTIEDPVEYQLPDVLQIPVNEKKGLTFARGLRSILRHDPDKILVGEIRDPETAQIAVQSALTGHLVFTSVHANNVFDVLGRFLHMGLDAYSFVSALNGILAQRLIRVVCPACAVRLQRVTR
ncbi:MAG: GspE/PulE family protein [Propionivibrio sp.]